MRIKKFCNCASEELTEQGLKNLIFEAIQVANKDQRERMLIIENGVVSHIKKLEKVDIEDFKFNVLAYIKINDKLSNVELLQNISRNSNF